MWTNVLRTATRRTRGASALGRHFLRGQGGACGLCRSADHSKFPPSTVLSPGQPRVFHSHPAVMSSPGSLAGVPFNELFNHPEKAWDFLAYHRLVSGGSLDARPFNPNPDGTNVHFNFTSKERQMLRDMGLVSGMTKRSTPRDPFPGPEASQSDTTDKTVTFNLSEGLPTGLRDHISCEQDYAAIRRMPVLQDPFREGAAIRVIDGRIPDVGAVDARNRVYHATLESTIEQAPLLDNLKKFRENAQLSCEDDLHVVFIAPPGTSIELTQVVHVHFETEFDVCAVVRRVVSETVGVSERPLPGNIRFYMACLDLNDRLEHDAREKQGFMGFF